MVPRFVSVFLAALLIATACGPPAAPPTTAPPTTAPPTTAPPTTAPPTAAPPTTAPPTAAPPTAAPAAATAAAPAATSAPAGSPAASGATTPASGATIPAAATAPAGAATGAAGAATAPAGATSVASASPAAGGAAGATAPAGAAAPAGDARSALGEIFRGWTGVKTFRARITGSLPGSGAAQTNLQMEVVLPDRVRGTVAAGGANMEMIMAGGSTYMKMPTGQWIKAPGAPIDFGTMDPKRYENDFRGSVSNVSLVGPEVVDGTPTLVYQYDVAEPAAPAGAKVGPMHAKVWVGVADRLPRKLEVSGGPGGGTTTITYYDYNAPITIEAPIP
jgi:hypothetical protein